MSRQRQAGGKRGSLGDDINMVAVGSSCDRPCNKACRFAPGAGHRASRISGVRPQLEIVAVAGTANIELQIPLVGRHVVGRPAFDRLALAIRQIDGTGAGPLTCQTFKWCYALCAGGICNANCKRERKRGYAPKLFQPARWRSFNRRPSKVDAITTEHTRPPVERESTAAVD